MTDGPDNERPCGCTTFWRHAGVSNGVPINEGSYFRVACSRHAWYAKQFGLLYPHPKKPRTRKAQHAA